MSDSLESSDEKYKDDNGTGAEDSNCDIYEDRGEDNNTGAVEGSVECIRFPIPRARTQALGAMAKSKASSSTSSRKKIKLVKSKSKISRK